MTKRGKNQKKGPQYSKKIKLNKEDSTFNNNMEDEVDAFHSKRDMIPLDINADDIDSDEDDDEQPIFDYEGIDGDEDDDDDEDEDFDEYEDDDDSNLKGEAAKLARQAKYMKTKVGGIEDDENGDAEEDEKVHKVWSRGKGAYYGTDNKDFELQSSGEDTPAEEEEEVIKLQKERAESMRPEDFGIESDGEDDSDQEPTLEEIKGNRKPKPKSSSDKEDEVDAVPMYEEVKKDLSALSKEEQMDVVYNSAPELVGLLAELNDATKQLETYVNPLLSKVRKGKNDKKEALHYMEVKQLLLLSYCQAITFYLLLKSEGQSVRDHPVIARLVEIKGLLDKMKELDVHIPDGLENVLVEKGDIATAIKPIAKGNVLSSDLFADLNELTRSSIENQDSFKLRDKIESIQMQPAELDEKKRRMDKHQDQQVSSESVKMLQHRAALAEKLKQKAGSVVPKTDNNMKQKQKKLIGKLETTDDFDDDVMDLGGTTHDVKRASTLSSKLSQIVPSKGNMLKGVSGDDDLPERDDLGERRWKHELRILSGAGIKSKDDDYDPQFEDELDKLHDGANAGDSDNDGGSDSGGSEDDYYNQIKRQKEAKRSLKAAKYSRNPQGLYEPETTADGKRHITTQMAKNKGLIRQRKKQNPRTRNKSKYAKATKRRAGQVREVKQPIHSYGGETTGINPNISRSNRF